jgi:hypothetical protein
MALLYECGNAFLLLLPPGEGWDEGLETKQNHVLDPLTLTLSRWERGQT